MSWSTSQRLLYGLNHAQESVASRFCFPQRIAGDFGWECCNLATAGNFATHLTKRLREPKLPDGNAVPRGRHFDFGRPEWRPSICLSAPLESSLGLGSATDLCTCRPRFRARRWRLA